HLVLLVDGSQGPEELSVFDPNFGQSLLGNFLGDGAVRHDGNSASLSAARLTVSMLSNSITCCTSTPCSFRILSIARRVGMSGSNPMNFWPSISLRRIDLDLANACCG